MDEISDKWLAEFRRLNGFNRTAPVLNEIGETHRILSTSLRAGPRHARILRADKLSIIVTNRRARAGLKPKTISR